MPIPSEDIRTTDVVVLEPGATVRDALAKLPSRRAQRAYTYVVVPQRDGTYLVPRWIEVEQLAIAAGRDITDMRIADARRLLDQIDTRQIRDLPSRFTPAEAVEQASMGLQAARSRQSTHPARRLVVLKDGRVIGLLVTEFLTGASLPDDPFAREATVTPLAVPPALRGRRIASLPGLPNPVAAVDLANLAADEARQLASQQPDGRLVVLEQGRVAGLLLSDTPVDAPEGVDPFQSLEAEPAPPSPGGKTQPPATVEPVDTRVINVWLDGQQSSRDPLRLGQVYVLQFNVDEPRVDAAGGSSGRQAQMTLLHEAGDLIELTVRLITGDLFVLHGEEIQILRLPLHGPSLDTIGFRIEPRAEGIGTITAIIYIHNEVFQQITTRYAVGEAASRELAQLEETGLRTSGRNLADVVGYSRRRENTVSLVILPSSSGYTIIVQSESVQQAEVKVTQQRLAEWIAFVRDELRKAFLLGRGSAPDDSGYTGPDTTIPQPVYEETLVRLAGIGRELYTRLFYNSGPDAAALGDFLRALPRERSPHISLVFNDFVFPWALLYDGSPSRPNPEGFWGFRHIIEQLPEFSASAPMAFQPEIETEGAIELTFFADPSLDRYTGGSLILDQRQRLAALPTIALSEQRTVQELRGVLLNDSAPLILYLGRVNNPPSGSDASGTDIGLALQGGMVKLSTLLARTVNAPPLRRAPLLFLNACATPELTPYLYSYLAPILASAGARGVVGAEWNVPQFFAAEFGFELLSQFVRGEQTLGETLLDLRRRYCYERRNLLGLLYGLYASSDIIIRNASRSSLP